MSRICPLFSSSKGNSTWLSGGGSSLLVDAGVSFKQLRLALAELDADPSQLSGILITHEHSDHIKGLPVLLKRHPLPLYASRGTLTHLLQKGMIPPGVPIRELDDTATTIDGIEITPFPTPHDANDSMGFRFSMPDQRTIAIATDLGHVSDTVREHITGCDLVMLESNYDPRMLDCSQYPYSLKRRIKGNFGHLSNEVCGEECVRLIRSGATRIILGHLSENNNLPEIARQAVSQSLSEAGMQENSDYILGVAPARGQIRCTIF